MPTMVCGTGSAVEVPCQGHPACEEHCYSYRSERQSYSSHVPPSFAEHHSPHPIVATSVHTQVWPQLDGVPGKIAQRVRKDRQHPQAAGFSPAYAHRCWTEAMPTSENFFATHSGE